MRKQPFYSVQIEPVCSAASLSVELGFLHRPTQDDVIAALKAEIVEHEAAYETEDDDEDRERTADEITELGNWLDIVRNLSPTHSLLPPGELKVIVARLEVGTVRVVEMSGWSAWKPDEQTLCQAVARGWCHPDNAHKEMDADLANAIVTEVLKVLQ